MRIKLVSLFCLLIVGVFANAAINGNDVVNDTETGANVYESFANEDVLDIKNGLKELDLLLADSSATDAAGSCTQSGCEAACGSNTCLGWPLGSYYSCWVCSDSKNPNCVSYVSCK